jgi:hypothetical protein
LNPTDPLRVFEETARLLERVQRDIAARVPGDQAAEIARKFDTLRGQFQQAEDRLRTALANAAQADTKMVDAEAMLEKLRSEQAADEARFAALSSLPAEPPLPPPPKIELLGADALAELLLGELGPVAPPPRVIREDPGSIGDDLPAFDEADAAPGVRIPVADESARARPLPQRPVRVDPGSVGDDLPATDEDLPVAELTLPLLPELARGVAGVSPQARALLGPNLAMGAYVAALLQAKHFADLGRLLAAELPVREAVWWVGLCIQHGHSRGAGRTAVEKAALRAAIAWVLDPIGPNREGARAAGESAGPKNASGCLARAAGQRPIALAASRPEVTEESAAQLVDCALRLTCPTPDDCPELFVMLGLGVAARELSWKKLVAAPGTAASSPASRDVRVAPSAQPAASTGHGLGKQLLLDLGLVAPPRSNPKRRKRATKTSSGRLPANGILWGCSCCTSVARNAISRRVSEPSCVPHNRTLPVAGSNPSSTRSSVVLPLPFASPCRTLFGMRARDSRPLAASARLGDWP